MLGWDVTVSRPRDALTGPDDPQALLEDRLPASRLRGWSAEIGGLGWLDTLCDNGDGRRVADNGGYPLIYVIRAGALAPFLADPPGRRRRPIDPLLEGAPKKQPEQGESPDSDEWLLVTVWDRS